MRTDRCASIAEIHQIIHSEESDSHLLLLKVFVLHAAAGLNRINLISESFVYTAKIYTKQRHQEKNESSVLYI